MFRLKHDYALLKKIFDENGATLSEEYKEMYLTRDTRIIAKCILCENIFNKSFNKINKNRNFGCEKCTKILKFNRAKKSMMDKYGVEFPSQCEQFKDKMKKTSFERFGVEHATQSQQVKDKIVKTNMEKYGVKYGLQDAGVKEKKVQTYLKNYGVENPNQCKEIREKTKKTVLEKYGVEYCSQNPDVMDKMTKHMYKMKEYMLPSGKIIQIQGYENYGLDELFEKDNIDENDIVTGCKNVPTIWYEDENGKKRRHFVDIFIPSKNLCIEIKSTWTAKKNGHTIFLKQKAAKELGYGYEIWVYDTKGIKVDFYN